MPMEPLILAIDTSCDETAAAVVWGRRILSNVISSQVDIHAKYGGVYPALAKRAHQERIEGVVAEALRRARVAYQKLTRYESTTSITSTTGITSNQNAKCKMQNAKPNSPHNSSLVSWFTSTQPRSEYAGQAKFKINRQLNTSVYQSLITDHCPPLSAVAVTQGPGLAIALEVGITKAKELAFVQNQKSKIKNQNDNLKIKTQKTKNNSLPIIAVNHLEGHILSTIAQNSMGKPEREIPFPALALVVSGGNTQMLMVHAIGKYELIGETLDDACGEALDKAARILQLGYPGGPIIERLALTGDPQKYVLKPTLTAKNNLNFSYSGLKTAFLYRVQKLPKNEFGANLNNLAAAFQYRAFEQIQRKLTQAIALYQPKSVLCGGGVIVNRYLRKILYRSASINNVPIYFPTNKLLYGDNAAMIGIAAYYKFMREEFIKPEELDRKPRFPL